MSTQRYLPAFSALFLFPLMNAAGQNSPTQGQHQAPTYVQQTCPTISVSCPSDLVNGEPLIFTATVNGGDPNVIPTFNWTVSAGKIIRGQGSSSITVDTVGFAGQAFTGTVSIAGFDSACSSTASCSLIGEHFSPESIKFDSYRALPGMKEHTRLSAFAVQLKNAPGAQGYLLVYVGRRGLAGEAKKAAARSQEYLVKTRGIDARRIVTVHAGFKEEVTIDLWLVPTGAIPPVADPTIDPGEVRITKPVHRRSARH